MEGEVSVEGEGRGPVGEDEGGIDLGMQSVFAPLGALGRLDAPPASPSTAS